MKNNRKNESYTSAWETANSWPVHDTSAAAVVETVVPSEDIKTPPGYVKYRAIYEFSARNADEITFQPGDIVMVSSSGFKIDKEKDPRIFGIFDSLRHKCAID